MHTGCISRALPVTALTLLALIPFSASAQEVERFALTGDVAIFNIAGNVVIERGTSGRVVVEVMRGGEDAGRLQIETSGLEGWQTLRVLYPSNDVVYPRMSGRGRTQFDVAANGTFGRKWGDGGGNDFNIGALLRMVLGERKDRVTVTGSGRGLEAYADLRVLVPPGQTVAVHLGVGEVQASNIEGKLLVDARSAPIVARDISGSTRLATGSGTIELTGAQGDIILDTGSGHVRFAEIAGDRLSVDTGSGRVTGNTVQADRFDVDTGSGSVEISGVRSRQVGIDTGSGSVRLDNVETSELSVETGSGSVNVDLRSKLARADIDTGSGGVTFTVPDDFGATIHLSTGSGGISVDQPVRITHKKRDLLRGTIGDGSAQIKIDTGSGGIRIRSR